MICTYIISILAIYENVKEISWSVKKFNQLGIKIQLIT